MTPPYTRDEAADLLRRLRAKKLPATPKVMPDVVPMSPATLIARRQARRVAMAIQQDILASIRRCERLEAAIAETEAAK